jgi:hypothetical protein
VVGVVMCQEYALYAVEVYAIVSQGFAYLLVINTGVNEYAASARAEVRAVAAAATAEGDVAQSINLSYRRLRRKLIGFDLATQTLMRRHTRCGNNAVSVIVKLPVEQSRQVLEWF